MGAHAVLAWVVFTPRQGGHMGPPLLIRRGVAGWHGHPLLGDPASAPIRSPARPKSAKNANFQGLALLAFLALMAFLIASLAAIRRRTLCNS